LTLEGKLAAQKRVRSLEAQRNLKRRSLFDAQDQIDGQRDGMIVNIGGRLQQSASMTRLFLSRWRLA
jgi:adenine-specific DNA-methyltransferase